MIFEDWIKKDVYVRLKSGRFYKGHILKVESVNDSEIFLTFKDKYDNNLIFASSEIEVIQEEKHRDNLDNNNVIIKKESVDDVK